MPVEAEEARRSVLAATDRLWGDLELSDRDRDAAQAFGMQRQPTPAASSTTARR